MLCSKFVKHYFENTNFVLLKILHAVIVWNDYKRTRVSAMVINCSVAQSCAFSNRSCAFNKITYSIVLEGKDQKVRNHKELLCDRSTTNFTSFRGDAIAL